MEIEDYVDPSNGAIELQCEECLETFICEKNLSAHWSEEHGPKLYPCSICELTFILPSILKKHTEVVHYKDTAIRAPHQCHLCKLQFITEQLLERHHELIHPKDYRCGHCGKVFKSEQNLCYHIQEKHIVLGHLVNDEISSKAHLARQLDGRGDNQEKCLVSTKVSESKETVETPASDDHTSEYVCDKCGKRSSSLFNLSIHMGLHKFHCNVCGAAFDSVDYLALHKDEHRDEKSYVCTVCSMRLNKNIVKHNSKMTICKVCTKCGLKEHASTCRGSCLQSSEATSRSSKNSQYECKFCEEVCESKELLKKHISHNHRSEQLCDTCGKVLSSLVALRKHKNAHRGISSKRKRKLIKDEHGNDQQNCPFCGIVVRSQVALKGHVERSHTSCVCDKCGKVFSSLLSLAHHLDTIHNEVRKVVCMICDKVCKRKADLAVHLRTHTGERPYVCKLCSRSFINTSNLKHHLCLGPREESIQESIDERTNDKSEDKQYNCQFCAQVFKSKETARLHVANDHKSHVCEKCGKVLTSSHGLRQHLLRHSGIKPFNCTFCDERFVRRSTLNRHLRKHTGKRSYICDVCCMGFNTDKNLEDHKCWDPREESNAVAFAESDELFGADQIQLQEAWNIATSQELG